MSRTGGRLSAAGVIGTIVLVAVVLGCVRLGLWQLDRRAQRLALNEQVRQRQHAPALTSGDALADTATALYRSVRLTGRYDAARSIVLPGRSLKGVPGVHLLTPFRFDDTHAVLVNRGWVPAADGATIEPDSFPVAATALQGLVLPLPGRAEPATPRNAVRTDGFRVVWYALDEAALRGQFPYTLAPVVIQLLPDAAAPRYPRRLEPPALSQGPHLSYALQWFGFAAIGIVGWIALLLQSRRARRASALGLLACALTAPSAGAQLRPLDPIDWRIFEPGVSIVGEVGAARLFDQPATVAAAYGDLSEFGNYRLLWRAGRIALDLSGTAYWRFRQDSVRGTPLPGVAPPDDGIRADPGPALAATLVRLSPERGSTDVVLRFGTRIPTTSDESGLERDRTDFFALAGARWRSGAWALSGESGVGINGAQREDYPQSDVWIYTFGVQHQRGRLATFATLLGHQDGHSWRVQGNEDQGELRLGARFGGRWWAQAVYVHGLSGASPARGAMVSGGFVLGCRSDCLPFN